MESTRVLKEEHGGVRIMLGILDKVSGRLGAGQPVPTGDLDRILEFLKVFVDRCHHAKEEEFLFPALVRAGVPGEGGPVAVMLSEHEKGREYVRGMADAAAGAGRGDRGAAKRFVHNARGYRELLLPHIWKEDEVLFPLADETLDEATDRRLVEEFDKVEEERVGHGKHEEFHRLMDELGKAYA